MQFFFPCNVCNEIPCLAQSSGIHQICRMWEAAIYGVFPQLVRHKESLQN